MATNVGESASAASVAPTSGTSNTEQFDNFMQSIYARVNSNRQVQNEKYVTLISELNDANNKAAMISQFKEAVASYSGEAADFEEQVLVPFRQEHPGFDEAFDISPFRTGDGYDLRGIMETIKQSQDSLNNISSQKQLEINTVGQNRDQYTAFISKFIQDLNRLLERLLN